MSRLCVKQMLFNAHRRCLTRYFRDSKLIDGFYVVEKDKSMDFEALNNAEGSVALYIKYMRFNRTKERNHEIKNLLLFLPSNFRHNNTEQREKEEEEEKKEEEEREKEKEIRKNGKR